MTATKIKAPKVGEIKKSQLDNIRVIEIEKTNTKTTFSRFDAKESFYKTLEFKTGEVEEIGYQPINKVLETLETVEESPYQIKDRDGYKVLIISTI
jgi:hypothetical protein